MGSECEISFFAEQVNRSGVSDRISAQPVSMRIVVSEAVPFKFTYNIDGGSGADVARTSEVKSGTSFSLADGSLLQKGGSPFVKWLVTYKLSGDIYQTQLLLKSGQLFTMPNADVTATALYSGISFAKDSTTEGQEKFLVTFDPNGGLWGDSEYAIAVPIIPGGQCADPGKPKRDGYKFTGWFNREVGGEEIDITKAVFTGHTYLYAHWEFINVFLAEKTSDPYNIIKGYTDDKFYSIEKVKQVADLIKRGQNPNTDVFNATNDRWHLFALMSGDGSDENDWYEFRIIHVWSHDGDGSGLTFQQTHTPGHTYPWMRTGETHFSNWADSLLRRNLNDSYFNSLPQELKTAIKKVGKTYTISVKNGDEDAKTSTAEDYVWVLSGTELVYDASLKFRRFWSNNSFEGSTYDFWKTKDLKQGVLPFSDQAKLIKTLTSDRNGKGVYSRNMFSRSISPNDGSKILTISSINVIEEVTLDSAKHNPFSPCFCL